MRNRAKCRRCQSVVESFHPSDLVFCKCGEIAVDGGDALKCAAKDWTNFLRVDDEDNEIVVQVREKESDSVLPIDLFKNDAPSLSEKVNMIDEMIKSIERIPEHAKSNAINHYDFSAALLLVSSCLRSLCKE